MLEIMDLVYLLIVVMIVELAIILWCFNKIAVLEE